MCTGITNCPSCSAEAMGQETPPSSVIVSVTTEDVNTVKEEEHLDLLYRHLYRMHFDLHFRQGQDQSFISLL